MRRAFGNIIEADLEAARCSLDLMRAEPMAAAREKPARCGLDWVVKQRQIAGRAALSSNRLIAFRPELHPRIMFTARRSGGTGHA